MALYWHPYLTDLLRAMYADRLVIRDQVPLGELPLVLDLHLIRRDPTVDLPYPFNFLGRQTLVEYKSPDDSADQRALEQLLIYAHLFVRHEAVAARADLTLWLVASQVTSTLSQPSKTELREARPVGPGVTHGAVDGFPTYGLNLAEVPFTPDTVPLHMVAKGPPEQRLLHYLLTQQRQQTHLLEVMSQLHTQALEEYLMRHNLTLEQIGLDEAGQRALLNILGGLKGVTRLVGPKQIVEAIGPERLLEEVDPRRLVEAAAKQLSDEQIHELLAQRRKAANGAPQPPPG